MRRPIWVVLLAGLLVSASFGIAAAQDDDPPAGAATGVKRIERPELGIGVSLPSAWDVSFVDDEEDEMALPPGAEGEAWAATVLRGESDDGVGCGLEVHHGDITSLQEHVDWVEKVNRADPGFEGFINHTSVVLPAGEAVRVDGYHQGDGVWTTMYLLDRETWRYLLYCSAPTRSEDDYRSIADTIRLLPVGVPDYPDEALGWTQASDFWIVVHTARADEANWMNAWCRSALWIKYDDGSYEERLDCTLSDEPVDPPERQGQRPSLTVFFSGGACEWISDFWLIFDGSEVWADSYTMSVSPDGSVLAVALYGPEDLECAVE